MHQIANPRYVMRKQLRSARSLHRSPARPGPRAGAAARARILATPACSCGPPRGPHRSRRSGSPSTAACCASSPTSRCALAFYVSGALKFSNCAIGLYSRRQECSWTLRVWLLVWGKRIKCGFPKQVMSIVLNVKKIGRWKRQLFRVAWAVLPRWKWMQGEKYMMLALEFLENEKIAKLQALEWR